jgi:hypothetical protein
VQLDELKANIVGRIEVIASFGKNIPRSGA